MHPFKNINTSPVKKAEERDVVVYSHKKTIFVSNARHRYICTPAKTSMQCRPLDHPPPLTLFLALTSLRVALFAKIQDGFSDLCRFVSQAM